MLGNFYQGTTFSQTQGLVGLRMRSVAAGVLLFILNIIGLGAGPLAVGIASDLLVAAIRAESLRYALLFVRSSTSGQPRITTLPANISRRILGESMTIQDLGDIGDLIGGIAVVATLIYLAAQGAA